jgi:7-cyano-7-deazaguanine synthase
MNQSIVLFSGGVDSTTALYWSLAHFDQVEALTFDYGPRQKREVEMTRTVTKKLGLPHKIFECDLGQIGGSPLTDSSIPVPDVNQNVPEKNGLPSTYVPFRNGIFLSLASAWAEVKQISAIVCGFTVFDSPDYPDTRKDFTAAMEKAVNLGTGAHFNNKKLQFLTPFINQKKSEIIKQGLALGVDYSYSISCYRGEEIPCRSCSSCVFRQRAWSELGQQDPLLVRLEREGKL